MEGGRNLNPDFQREEEPPLNFQEGELNTGTSKVTGARACTPYVTQEVLAAAMVFIQENAKHLVVPNTVLCTPAITGERVEPIPGEVTRQKGKGKINPSPTIRKDFSLAKEDSSEDVLECSPYELKKIMERKRRTEGKLREMEEMIMKQQKGVLRVKQTLALSEVNKTPRLKQTLPSLVVSKKRVIEEHEEESKDYYRKTNRTKSLTRRRGNPFTEKILADRLPSNYKPITIEYNGKGDPDAHVSRFEGMVTLHQYSEGIKCWIFSTTLVGIAQRWFQELEEGSISCFEDLYQAFVCQFSSSREMAKSAMTLMVMK